MLTPHIKRPIRFLIGLLVNEAGSVTTLGALSRYFKAFWNLPVKRRQAPSHAEGPHVPKRHCTVGRGHPTAHVGVVSLRRINLTSLARRLRLSPRKIQLGRERRRLIALFRRRPVSGRRSCRIVPKRLPLYSRKIPKYKTPRSVNESRGILLHPSANPAILVHGDWAKAIRNPGGQNRLRPSLPRRVWCVLRLLLLSWSQLVRENLAACDSNGRSCSKLVSRPRLRPWDRLFWVWLSRWWSGCKDALAIVAPATVVGWHR